MADKWTWKIELKRAHLTQASVGEFLGISKSQMSHLVKKMIEGQGLIATETDKERWNKALEYIDFKKNQLSKEA